MGTFFLFGKYTSNGIKQISGERTVEARQLIEKFGGRVRGIYALMGEHDIVFIVELNNMTDAMKASISLGRMTGISFATAAAVPVEDLDKLVGEL